MTRNSFTSAVKDVINGSATQKVLFMGALASILWSVYFSLVTISIPYQLEFHEGTALVLTDMLLKRDNPFTLEHQPLGMTNYGIGYSVAVLPFAAVFGSTLLAHRLVTFIFIILSALLGFLVVYRGSNKNVPASLTCMAFIMIGLIARGGIGAFPSGMGTFLFLAAILLPYVRSFDNPSLILSVLFSLAAFYTKPYFVLAFGVMASYLFLFVSKQKGFFYGLIFSMGLVFSAVLTARILPVYFTNTLLGNVANTSMTSSQLLRQLTELVHNFYPVLLLLMAFITIKFYKSGSTDFSLPVSRLRPDLFNWNSPVFSFPVSFLLYCFFCSLVAFVLILGPHIGNYMSYAYQLLVPTFFCWFFCEVRFDKKWMALLALALTINLFLWSREYLSPDMLDQRRSAEWQQLFDHVHSSNTILNSPMVTSEVVRLGITPVDSGQTAFFYSIGDFPQNVLIDTSYESMRRDGADYVRLIDRMIEKQRFDLILTFKGKDSFYHEQLVFEYYSVLEEIEINTPQVDEKWTILVWKPLTE